jgi:hypothetical protein
VPGTGYLGPLRVPDGFWERDDVRQAVAARNIAAILTLLHRCGASQTQIGNAIDVAQPHVGAIMRGTRKVVAFDLYERIADGLTMPDHARETLGLARRQPASDPDNGVGANARVGGSARLAQARVAVTPPAADPPPSSEYSAPRATIGEHRETDDMDRRDLLRHVSMISALAAAPMDWQRLTHGLAHPAQLDVDTLDEFDTLNSHLWRVFVLSTAKRSALPLTRAHIGVLVDSLTEAPTEQVRHRHFVLLADLFQLAGEVFFDSNDYTEAAHCYTAAAAASKQAHAYDLWACALTRHAFINVYEQRFAAALPMLDLAAELARHGDTALSTRYWVAAVAAEAYAGLGQIDPCQRALDHAEQVHALAAPAHTGGWLRFDGSRLAELRGTCYTALHRPDLAETVLTTALSQRLSARRRGGVLVDLALLGVQTHDLDLLLHHADAAIALAHHTGSGVITRRLTHLRTQLAPMLDDAPVRDLHHRIAELTGTSTAAR